MGGDKAWSVNTADDELRGDVRSKAPGDRLYEYDVNGDVSDVLGDDKSNALSGDVSGEVPENGSGDGVWNNALLSCTDLLVSGEISASEYLSVELVWGLLSWKENRANLGCGSLRSLSCLSCYDIFKKYLLCENVLCYNCMEMHKMLKVC